MMKHEIHNLQLQQSNLKTNESIKLNIKQALMVTSGFLTGNLNGNSINLGQLDIIREREPVTLTATETTK